MLDLFGKAIPASEGDDAQLARREALYFLTRERGAWAESRSRLCGACGIDPDALRLNILRILDGGEFVGADARNAFGGIEKARAFWQADQSAPAEAAAQRTKQTAKRQAPPCRVKPSYSAARSAVLPLLTEPRQFKELIIATHGEYGDGMIRKVLASAMQKGEVVRDDAQHTYVLADAA